MKYRFSIPQLKKLCKRGSNAAITEWLIQYLDISMRNRLAELELRAFTKAFDYILENIENNDIEELKKLLKEAKEKAHAAIDDSLDDGRIQSESKSHESSGSGGTDSGDPDSSS